MDKKEVIQKIEALEVDIGLLGDVLIRKDKVLTIIGRLKEQKIPRIPQSVADLIEEYRDAEVVLMDILKSFHNWHFYGGSGNVDWIVDNPEEFLLAWINNKYEVIKD